MLRRWFYLSGIAILVGGETNAILENAARATESLEQNARPANTASEAFLKTLHNTNISCVQKHVVPADFIRQLIDIDLLTDSVALI